MMNANDALGALEDVTIFRNLSGAMRDRVVGDEAEKNEQAFRMASVALRERAGTIERLKGELGDVHHNRNYAATLYLAASKTLDHVIRDFAKAAGVSEDELRKRYNMIRTQHFNQQVNTGVDQGWFNRDPRLDLSDEQKKWYQPGLDSDHGF